MSDATLTALEKAAEKAALDPFFLGHLLTLVGRDKDVKISERLQCDPDQITRLALCRCPREEAEHFQRDIERIAAFVNCDALALAQLVREARALEAFSAGDSSEGKNMLLAARDRLQDEGDGNDSAGDGNA